VGVFHKFCDCVGYVLVHGHHANGVTESDCIRWVGVVIAFVGTLVAAPAGTAYVIRAISTSGKSVGRQLARLLRLPKRHPVTHQMSAHVGVASGGSAIMAVGLGWIDSETDAEKIDRLHRHLGQVLEQVNTVRRETQQANASTRAALDQVAGELRAAVRSLENRIDTGERRAAQVDARGIVLIGTGVVLTGIPDGLARFAPVGWLSVALAGLLMLGILTAIWRERPRAAGTQT
jgi:hypothetical protein